MYSLIVTAKMNDVDPQAWLADVLARIAGILSKSSTNCCLGTVPAQRAGPSGGLTMAGISHVFTISRVAEMLARTRTCCRKSASKWIPKTAASPSSAQATTQ